MLKLAHKLFGLGRPTWWYPALTHRTVYHCGERPAYSPAIKHHAEIIIRTARRMFLNRNVLNQNKDVLYAELRKPSDTILSLRAAGKCPGVIVPLSGKKED